jgi:DNA-binding XRE family transcriptional regulator
MVRVDGRKLRVWRERRLLTLRELAAMSGVQFHTIHAIETGKQEPRVSTVRKLIRALEIPAEEVLAFGEDEAQADDMTGKAAA